MKIIKKYSFKKEWIIEDKIGRKFSIMAYLNNDYLTIGCHSYKRTADQQMFKALNKLIIEIENDLLLTEQEQQLDHYLNKTEK